MTGGRHDRTRLFVAEHAGDEGRFFGARVSITAGCGMLGTGNGITMLRTLVNLVSRFTDNLDIRLPDGCGPLQGEMIRLAESTGCCAGVGRGHAGPGPDVALSVGGRPAGGRLSVSANSSGWVSYVACGGSAGGQDGAVQNPIGAMGAACLASAEAFKGLLEAAGCAKRQVVDHPGMLALSLLDYAAYDPGALPGRRGGLPGGDHGPPAGDHGSRLPLPRRAAAGEIVLAGAGAVGSSFLYSARESGALDAAVRVVDYDAVDETNLNRCPAFFESDIGRPKAVAAEAMSRGGLKVAGTVSKLDEYMGRNGGLGAVVSAVDNRDARLDVQFDLPRVVFHGATGGAVAAVSVIKLPENACLCCIFDERGGREEAIANETGIPAEAVRKALAEGGPFTADHLAHVERRSGAALPGLRRLVGQKFEGVYAAEMCGRFSLRDGGAVASASVPFASFFAGLALAGEVVKHYSPGLRGVPMADGRDFVQVSLLSPRSLNLARRTKSPRCALRCSDGYIQDRFAAKWPGGWRAPGATTSRAAR